MKSYFCHNHGVNLESSEVKEITIKGLPMFRICGLCNGPKCLEEIISEG